MRSTDVVKGRGKLGRGMNAMANVKIGDKYFTCMFDTGASVSLVNTEMASQLRASDKTRSACGPRLDCEDPVRVEGVTAEGDKVHIGQMMNIELDFGEGRTCVPGRQGETAVVGSAKSVVAFGEMDRCQDNFIIGLKDVARWNMSVETDEQNNLLIHFG